MKFAIIHTNDIHSNYENFARATTLIKQLKDENTIILDGGDFADFKAIELRGTKGIAAVELLEYAGYHAITIGNNEMFNGIRVLEQMATKSSIPFISNNLFLKDRSPVKGVFSSTIIEKNGLRILVTGSSPDLGPFNDGIGIHVTSFKEALKQELKQHRGNYDICILLSHVGTACDEEIAREIPGIHIIISAHDHKLFPKAKVVNRVIQNSAGYGGEYIGLVEVEVTNGTVELIDSKTLSTKDVPMDEGVLDILRNNKEKAIENLSKPLYSLSRPLWHDVIEENPMTNLIADGLKDLLKADIGLINSGIANAGAFDYISEKKLIEISPSPLNPTLFEIQGKYLREALEQSLDAQVCLADGRGPGFRGKFVGRLHISGAEIYHNERNIQEIYIGDKPLDDEAWYRVATSDYLQRGSGYPSLANNRNERYLPEEIRDVIRMYAKENAFIEKAYIKRWRCGEGSSVSL
jgi:5'-nucleotidase